MNGTLYRDLRDAWYGLKRNPIFTLVVCSVLALGIGANTALFTVVNKVLLRPLPFAEPERLVNIEETKDGSGMNPSYPNYQDWCRMNQSFESLAYAAIFWQTLPGEVGAERVPVAFVSGNFFQTYRVQPSIGHLFAEPDDKQGAAPVAVLTRSFWMARFGADAGILGKTITLEKSVFTVIGVLPDFPYHDQADVYAPVTPSA
jgi:putative ABC transport system permease protein